MKSHFRVEFHCHTIYSKDSLTRPEKLVEVCRQKGIDRVVVTDHNTIQGGLKARQIDPERVIVGEEIMTQKGELLAAFVQEEIPPGLTPEETIRRLREQGAFISVSHPFDHYRSGHWQMEDLQAIAPLIDAVEVFNARVYRAEHNTRAREFAAEHALAGTAGSDAHAAFELGRATMLMPPFEDARTFQSALQEATIQGKVSSPWVHLTSRYAVLVKRLGLARR